MSSPLPSIVTLTPNRLVEASSALSGILSILRSEVDCNWVIPLISGAMLRLLITMPKFALINFSFRVLRNHKSLLAR